MNDLIVTIIQANISAVMTLFRYFRAYPAVYKLTDMKLNKTLENSMQTRLIHTPVLQPLTCKQYLLNFCQIHYCLNNTNQCHIEASCKLPSSTDLSYLGACLLNIHKWGRLSKWK